MDFNALLRGVDSIDKLKCKICNNFLSFFPIHTSADNRSTCGRCPQTDDQHRNEAFETLAQFIKFPCQHEGCKEKVLPEDMPHHEQVCPHKVIKCPTFKSTQCVWKGPFWSTLQHCRDQHLDLFLAKNEFEIDVEHSHEVENLIEFSEMLFTIWRKFDPANNLLKYSVCHIEHEINPGNITCKLKLTNGKRDIVDTFIPTSYNEQQVGEITFEMLKSHNNFPVFGSLTLDEEGSVERKVDEAMLVNLKCSLCSAYALPPIYSDTDNKIKCSMCAKKEGHSRNYSLENIAILLNYPCKYAKNGCSLVLKAGEIKKHQRFCNFGREDCPLKEYVKCDWYGLRKYIKEHLEEQHQDMIKDNYCIISEDFTKSFIKCYIIKFGDVFFKLMFAADPRIFISVDKNATGIHKWSLQTIAQYEKKFFYEIEIMDCLNQSKKLMAGQLCQPPMKDSEVFVDKESYCSFTDAQVDSLIYFCNICFKVNIFNG